MRKGERGTKVYFVKQLRVTESKEGEEAERLVPMMREYTVFNVAQTEGLPASIVEGKPARVRNPDSRDVGLLRQDKLAFFTAASKAQGAADYLRGLALAEPIAEAA